MTITFFPTFGMLRQYYPPSSLLQDKTCQFKLRYQLPASAATSSLNNIVDHHQPISQLTFNTIKMEYNTTRDKLMMSEYGRNVQKLVEHMQTIEDREKRTRFAEMIIDLMSTLNPGLKVMEDYRHKLWDHLYLMSDFKLDVDCPYDPPTPEVMFKKPDPLPYPQTKIKVRHFGKNLDALIQKALAEPDDEKRQSMTQLIGYYMKLAYINWHREPVHDDMIRNELSVLTDGKLKYEQGGYRVYFDNRQNYGGNKGRNKGRGGSRKGGNGNYGKNRNYKNRNK